MTSEGGNAMSLFRFFWRSFLAGFDAIFFADEEGTP